MALTKDKPLTILIFHNMFQLAPWSHGILLTTHLAWASQDNYLVLKVGDDEDEVGVHIEGGEDNVDQDDAGALPKLANPTSLCHLVWSIDFTTRATSSQVFSFLCTIITVLKENVKDTTCDASDYWQLNTGWTKFAPLLLGSSLHCLNTSWSQAFECLNVFLEINIL